MSKISWTGKTWNAIVGCSKVHARCHSCYAMGDSPHRFVSKYEREGVIILRGKATRPGMTFVPSARVAAGQRRGRTVLKRHDDDTITVSLGKGAQWTGEVRCLPWALDIPLRRKTPTTWFVNSLADMFHESLVESERGRRFIAAMYGVMAACPQHTFQILTKRDPRPWFDWVAGRRRGLVPTYCREQAAKFDADGSRYSGQWKRWPLPNVWIGHSLDDTDSLAALRGTPAALRFLSLEPMIEDPGELDLRGIAWCITGGESGSRARECKVEWLRSVVRQCRAAGVPPWVKQLGSRSDHPGSTGKGDDMSEWPEDLRVQEMPVQVSLDFAAEAT